MIADKKAIILYWHGLGDVIMLTPHLRYLYEHGYLTHLMCREEVITSHLLDECPYISDMEPVENPWQAENFSKQAEENVNRLISVCGRYDWVGEAAHLSHASYEHKMETTSRELGLDVDNYDTEVFIPEEVMAEVNEFVADRYPDGFIFKHTDIEFHQEHCWHSKGWIRDNLPDLPIVDTGLGGNFYRHWDDINYSFCLVKAAQHLVLSSSVFVHAADALGKTIDVINYGKKDRKVWPMDQGRVLGIRENGKWIKKYTPQAAQ